MALIDLAKQNAEEEALIEKIDYLISELKQTRANEEEEQILLDQLGNALDRLEILKKKRASYFNRIRY